MVLDQEKKAIRRKKGPGLVQEAFLLIIIADVMMSNSEINNQNEKVQGLEARINILTTKTIQLVLQESQMISVKRIL